jgi:hypothetical protein
MKEATAVRIRGWAECESAEGIARALFGAVVASQPVCVVSSSWRVEDSVAPDNPVGTVRSVVTIASGEAIEILIVPGSQGQRPPSTDAEGAIVRINLPAGQVLALDARCWYRLQTPAKAKVLLWLRSPVAQSLC